MKILSFIILFRSASDIGLAFLYMCVCVYHMRMQTHWMYIFCNMGSYVVIIVYSESLPMRVLLI